MFLNNNLIAKTPLVSSGRVYKSLMELCEIGNRWPGTVGEKRAAGYIQREMKSIIGNVDIEEYNYPHYTPLFSLFNINKPFKKTIYCIPLEYSKSGAIEGELIYVGEGWKKDFELLTDSSNTFKDKIVLARTNRPYIVSDIAIKLGAVGIVIISDSPFNTIRQITSQMGFTKEENLKNFGASIPGIIINKEDGEYVLSLLSNNSVEVKIEHKSLVDIRKSYNIIGHVFGSKLPDEKVIIGAHYDTQLDIVGAWDNGSGCSALLEICRACSNIKPKRTMVFCAFGCEEIGLFGSTNFVRNRENDVKNIISYINLDSTSADICYIHRILASKNMMDFALKIVKENTNWMVNVYREFNPLDHEQDSGEFVKHGINAIWASEEGNPYFHTKFDTIDTVSALNLAKATRVALLPFFYLANTDDIPFGAGL